MLEELSRIINCMEEGADDSIKDGWKQIMPLISPSGIITLTWPKWKLKIISFRMPDNKENEIENLRTIDELYVSKVNPNKDTIIWRTPQTESKYNWNDYEKPFVVDVVDWFLKGEWTPPWKCSHCMTRHKVTTAPKF